MFSLQSRLRLARTAAIVDPACAASDALVDVVGAGLGMLILADSGDEEADANALKALRGRFGRTQLLLGTADAKAAGTAQADVVLAEKPSWWQFSLHRPHEWSLMGRASRDARTVRKPGADYDFLVVGPVISRTSPLLAAALSEHPPLAVESTPWFARSTVADAEGLIATGARRIALDITAESLVDLPAMVKDLDGTLRAAWKSEAGHDAFTADAMRR